MSCVDVSILVDQANENLITTVVNRAIQSQTLRDIYEAEYTPGDPTSINPNAPTTTWSYSNTEQGDIALCAALMAFVYQFARSQADSVRAGQVGGLAAIALIAVLLTPGFNIFFLVGAAIAVLAGLGTVGVTTETAISALTDTTALDEVVCCMKENIKNASVSEATWAASLGGCGFTPGSNAQIVADFLGATLASNYLTFLDFMGTAYVGAGAEEAMPECPCADPPPCADGQEFLTGHTGWPDTGQTKWYSGEGMGPTHAGGVEQFNITRSSGGASKNLNGLSITFNMDVSNIRIRQGSSGPYAIASTVGGVLTINETTDPTMFPFNLAAVNLVISSNAASWIVPNGALRMTEICYDVL